VLPPFRVTAPVVKLSCCEACASRVKTAAPADKVIAPVVSADVAAPFPRKRRFPPVTVRTAEVPPSRLVTLEAVLSSVRVPPSKMRMLRDVDWPEPGVALKAPAPLKETVPFLTNRSRPLKALATWMFKVPVPNLLSW
jgi:hypothetical protein